MPFILTVKDDKGNVIPIPAIQGPSGKDGKDGKDGLTYEAEEQARAEAEAARVQAEADRVSAEAQRKTAEAQRVDAEGVRVSNETVRVQNEQVRATNEGTRAQAETDRVAAETARVLAEANRVIAETARENKETGYVAQAANAAKAAQEAITKTPTIIDGTWWAYDPEKAAYVDTGVQAQGAGIDSLVSERWVFELSDGTLIEREVLSK